MKKMNKIIAIIMITLGISSAHSENSNLLDSKDLNLLTGDTKLSCEALLCLWGGETDGECSPSVKKYYSLVSHSFRHAARKTAKMRRDFLELCPLVDMKLVWSNSGKSFDELRKEREREKEKEKEKAVKTVSETE